MYFYVTCNEGHVHVMEPSKHSLSVKYSHLVFLCHLKTSNYNQCTTYSIFHQAWLVMPLHDCPWQTTLIWSHHLPFSFSPQKRVQAVINCYAGLIVDSLALTGFIMELLQSGISALPILWLYFNVTINRECIKALFRLGWPGLPFAPLHHKACSLPMAFSGLWTSPLWEFCRAELRQNFTQRSAFGHIHSDWISNRVGDIVWDR